MHVLANVLHRITEERSLTPKARTACWKHESALVELVNY